MTGGPLVARGKVMVGTTGRAEGGNYIVALDAETGKEAWRFYTIARPGRARRQQLERRCRSRSGTADRSGFPGATIRSTTWRSSRRAIPTTPARSAILVNQPGVTNDALYLDSTLALDPDTGKLAWHFQHQANGQWDLDWAFERQVMQLPVNGDAAERRGRPAGKQMIFDIVEAETGKYLSSIDLGLQNVVTAIDPKTGAKIVDPEPASGRRQDQDDLPARERRPRLDADVVRRGHEDPVSADRGGVHGSGARRRRASAEACRRGVRWTVRPRPESDGKYGRLQALNLETKKTVWVERQRAPLTTGTLATAGGARVRRRRSTGCSARTTPRPARQLWKTRLNDVPSSAPISYSANGQEYVAVVVGPGGYQSNSYDVLVPEIQNPPDHGAAIWVFEVPNRPPAKATR